MNTEVANMWATALRSGKYKQGSCVLHNVTKDTWCCLGVLCDLYQKSCPPESVLAIETKPIGNVDQLDGFDLDELEEGTEVLSYIAGRAPIKHHNDLPYEVAIWAGIDTTRPGWRKGRVMFQPYNVDMESWTALSELNDTRSTDGVFSFDFMQIADIIELNQEYL